ncbi:phosphatidylinositol N-acetylglucosaminyltransferase [Cordyceps fumosorosea ARSEF 2679]|uniref:Phosphatidylinositol N-acetylglucosaminyltransferase n=1 Tax=Cordyceps fumosorosea (strain ARSEF 2679) TaxID=1081104 RepID=A0A162MBW4_CORFA|nr:phosphatidylinositol N-acetylglucosaminyltransferase [Cordyceps fumosorosea ARSEF 2679]OAA53990.1 phosphatidylinositol N-acetylglucosaminyltransferase [Cordyceps fumosorosea ARSEF 2679]
MFTTPPRLQIRRPSPTTTEFTVTTRPPPTVTLHFLRLLLLLLRLGLALLTILLLDARLSQSGLLSAPSPSPTPLPPVLPRDLLSLDALLWARAGVHRSPAGLALSRAAAAVPLPVLLPVAALALRLLARRAHAEESLLVMRGLGVQTRESSRDYWAPGAATRFIPTEKIRDVLVNEAFRGFEVRYYLVVVVEGEEDLVVVFPGLLPRRRIVEAVWRGARECLYEKREEKTPVL